MDFKIWALIISLLALTLSLITFVRTHLWYSLKFNCRIIDFSYGTQNDDYFYENKFFISSSGNQNLYIDKLFINEGENIKINENSECVKVQKLLKPGDIEEFICRNDASIFSHNKTYTFIFTLISADTDQFHCSLQISTKEQNNKNLIVDIKNFGSGFLNLNSLDFRLMNKIRQSRKQRNQN